MTINFEAANMVGYNYPHTMVLRAVMDETRENFVKFPSFEEVENALSRNIVPFVLIEGYPLAGFSMVLHMTAFDSDHIYFSSDASTTANTILAFTRGGSAPSFN